ncbi:hypothetical protein BHE90_009190 [Fusarium euwallaceae]|uniref:Uncharacterized protein n=4 Tax=Fusarium solani species complex TaxID=232080 RepID=A0A3M2SAD0_9HYPO|nr:hypothetical protein CDV36_006222 [Fusarium kuroshium]RSL77423.1 hypothetical protein CEP51_009090 [Fusarium floridanum]RSM02159.1 hypothetical protein CEP52_008127 [Fusarium oligoseptatum]RTE76363.1 hypothetical protein BHE90_009190 [Fusarium euwallaceae]
MMRPAGTKDFNVHMCCAVLRVPVCTVAALSLFFPLPPISSHPFPSIIRDGRKASFATLHFLSLHPSL